MVVSNFFVFENSISRSLAPHHLNWTMASTVETKIKGCLHVEVRMKDCDGAFVRTDTVATIAIFFHSFC